MGGFKQLLMFFGSSWDFWGGGWRKETSLTHVGNEMSFGIGQTSGLLRIPRRIKKSNCLGPKVMWREVGGNGQKSIQGRQEADGESSPAGLLSGTIYNQALVSEHVRGIKT